MDENLRQMVEYQLKRRGIADRRVLETMARIPRERFLHPDTDRLAAYHDGPLSIGYGQTISQPYIVALMTEALRLDGDEKVLEIGTGSGYQTAILAALTREVHTVERIGELSARAAGVLAELGGGNIHYYVGDGTLGWSEAAPFDCAIVTAGGPRVPTGIIEQVNPGGVIVMPIGHPPSQRLIRATVGAGRGVSVEDLCAVSFVKLVGADGFPAG